MAIDGTNDTCSYDNEGMTANQLFMSYGAFFTSLYLITEWSDATGTTTDWIFLAATSGTVFGVIFIGQPDIFQRYENAGELEIMLLVVVLSLGSVCISSLMILVSFLRCGKVGPFVHVTIGATLLTLWCVGSYFIVFEKEGVGSEIGPTFFACWGSLFFCVDIATTNLVLLFKKKNVGEEDDLESVSSLHHDEEENFVDEQKENLHDDEEPFLQPDSGYRTAEEDEILDIVTNGASSRIEYKEEFQTARDIIPETLEVNTTNLEPL